MMDALAEPFLRRVLLAGLLASVACGVIGTYVVARRITSMAGGLSHAAFGGVGLGYWLGFPPMLGAAGFGVLASLVVGVAHRRAAPGGIDTWTSMVWALGMALGILFVSLTPGYAPDLTSYLFGSLLFVGWQHVAWVGAVDAGLLLAVGLLFHAFEAVCFDEEYAEVAGIRAERVFLLLLALTALAVVALIRVVGVILALALLTIPAATARHWTATLGRGMALAVALSALATTGGLLLSYQLSASFRLAAPPGPLIVLLAAAGYGLSVLLRHLRGAPGSDPARPVR